VDAVAEEEATADDLAAGADTDNRLVRLHRNSVPLSVMVIAPLTPMRYGSAAVT
jgi:hypothetical protein